MALGLVSVVGLSNLRIDASTDSFIKRSGPSWSEFQASLDTFGDDQFVTVLISADTPFSRESMQAVQAATARLQRIDGVRRVDSLATVPLIRPDGNGGIDVNPAIVPANLASAESLASVIADIRADRIAPGTLVSPAGTAFALNVHFDGVIELEANRLVHEISVVAQAFGGVVSGVPVFRVAVNDRMQVELARFIPLVVVVTGAVLFALLGSLAMVSVALVAGGIGCLVTLGLMGLWGTPLTLTTMILPCVLFALGCAYSMHPLVAAQRARQRSSRLLAMGRVGRPVALSGLTTALGFASMATVQLGMIQELAAFGAVGVIVLTAAALSLVPALAVAAPESVYRGSILERAATPFPPFLRRLVTQRRLCLLGVWAWGVVVAGSGVFALRVSTDVVKWFDRGISVREDYEGIRKDLSGITPLNAVIRATGDQSVLAEEMLVAIDRFRAALEARPEVGRALAVTDALRQANAAFAGRDALPDSEDLAEQYLLFLAGIEQIDATVASDRAAANVIARVNDNESASIIGLAEWAQIWWRENGPPDSSLVVTGFMLQVARSAGEIASGLVRGLALALLAVGFVLVVVLKSWRRGAIAMVPNVLPIAAVFGAMGWLGMALDAATVVLGSLALGMAVDDTVHLTLAIQGERDAGYSLADSVERAVNVVLPALAATSLAVCVGFGVLGLSEFRPVSNLGVLTACLVSLCLAADLLLLPALLGPAKRTPRGK